MSAGKDSSLTPAVPKVHARPIGHGAKQPFVTRHGHRTGKTWLRRPLASRSWNKSELRAGLVAAGPAAVPEAAQVAAGLVSVPEAAQALVGSHKAEAVGVAADSHKVAVVPAAVYA